MASCNTDSLLADGKCFASCVSPGLYYPAKLALLCQIWQSLSPGADCSVDALLKNAACFNCIPTQMLTPLRLQLLCQIAGGGGGNAPNTPTNLDVSDISTNANTILTWSQVTAPDKNMIERSIDGGAYSQIAIISGTLTTYTDTATVGDGSLWRYRVKAMNGVQTSTPSNTVAVASNYNHNNDNLTSISIPDLILCYGNFNTTNEALLTIINVPLLREVFNDFQFASCPLLTSVVCSSLTRVSNQIIGSNSTALVTLSFPALVTVAILGPGVSLIDVSGSTSLTTVSIPNVTVTEGQLLTFTGCNLNAASVNQVLHRGVVSNVGTCDFELQGGTNAAPSGQGVADKTTLLGRGNIVNTN